MKEIKIGEYSIPEGCIAKIKNGVIIIRESRRKVIQEYRCRDCAYCSKGATIKASYWISDICLKKPKGYKNFKGDDCYKAVKLRDKICNNFKLKENDTTSEEQS